MEQALKKYGFSTDIVMNNTTKENIKEKMENLLALSQEGDRIIFYFSGHGTSIGEQGFLVPSDCKTGNKNNTCIGFDYLESWIKRMMDKKVKHLLVILDSCQSGLGVLSKSARISSVVELDKYSSAHMITAGLMGQDAEIDNAKKMSIFTMYLVKGLGGDADYTKDGVITLTELLLYVQDNVSRHVERFDKKQTPVMGKVKGAGEMLFMTRSE